MTALVQAKSEILDLPADAVIFCEGGQSTGLYVLLTGRVILSRSAAGRRRMVTLLGPGEIFGEVAFFDSGAYSVHASTMTAARVGYLDRTALCEAMSESPDMAFEILRAMSKTQRREYCRLADLIFLDVAGRLAAQLLDLGTRLGSSSETLVEVPHGLRQFEFGDLIGATRETVNKVLHQFVTRGWIYMEGRQVIILDPVALARRAQRELRDINQTQTRADHFADARKDIAS
jgi:CRP/FNR family transcriptional regulator